jgi:hypothetical protein
MIGWPVPEYHDSDTRCPGSGSEVAVSLKHLVNIAELESLGVAFVSLRDSLDLSSPVGRLMAQLLGAISEFERSLITERVRAGIPETAAARWGDRATARQVVPNGSPVRRTRSPSLVVKSRRK